MSAKDTIDARPETIGTLITFSSTPNTITVPVYQRFYQWDKSKALDLLRLTDPDSRDFGFIGTMVFVQTKDNRLEVVDGQQRLISIVLILCAFRDFIKEYLETCEDPETKRKLNDMAYDIQHDNLLVSKSYSEATDNPRIVFYRGSYDLFKERYLVGDKEFLPDEIRSRIELNHFANNYESAKEYLHDKYDHWKKEITPLLNKRLERLKNLVVNAIYITQPEYAGEVFESINGTGITLKLSELVKNYIFRSVPIAQAQAKWDQIESNCDNKSDLIENIIKYDWQNRYEETQDFEIFRSIKGNVTNVDNYLARLLRISKIFSFYLHPNAENFSYLKLEDNRNDKNHIIKLASTLRIIGVKQFLRFIIVVDTVREHIGINDYHRLLKNIHNFQVRAKVSNIGTNEIDRLYSRYGKKLQRISNDIAENKITKKEAPQVIRLLFNDLQSDLKKISTDETFAAGFTNFSRSKSTGKDFFKYLLSKIENHLQSSELIIDTKDNQITLEEIYPQEPAIGWSVTDLGSEDIYRIGNATILKGKDNGAGSNKVVHEKHAIYKKSNLLINKDIADLITAKGVKWDKETIGLRGESLGKIALEVWTL